VKAQLPILLKAKVREHRGGLPTMTSDGHHIVGPVPGAKGFFVLSGCNVAGLSIAPALGDAVAAWITEGQPPFDLSARWTAEPGGRFGLGRPYRLQYAENVLRRDCVNRLSSKRRCVGLKGHFPMRSMLVVAPARAFRFEKFVGECSKGRNVVCDRLARGDWVAAERERLRQSAASSRPMISGTECKPPSRPCRR
jgi:hypothetical protein